MKTMYSLLLAILFATASNGQVWQTFTPPIGDTVGWSDTKLLDNGTLWAVGVRYGVNDTFYSFGVPSETWFARTIDHGATFSTGTLPMGENPFIANMTATDDNTAYVIGLSNFGHAKTLKTTDAGLTWKNVNTPWDSVLSWPDYIHAFSPAKICVIGDPRGGEFEIYNSLNGGQYWQPVPAASIPDPLAGEFGYNNIGDAAGSTIWFGTSAGRVFRSKNSGLTWEAFQTPEPNCILLSFSDEMHGVMVNGTLTTSVIYKTSDGGQTWQNTTPNGGNFRVTGIECIPNSTYVLMNYSVGSVLKSANFSTWASPDRGLTWQQVSTGENVGWPEFTGPTEGWGGEFMQFEHKARVFSYSGSPLVGLFSEKELAAEIALFPNPASDFLQISLKNDGPPEDFLLLINDASGRLVRRMEFSKTSFLDEKISLAGLAPGSYTLTIAAAGGRFSAGVVKI